MRIWDIDPGFLNDMSLLGEHRELHGVYTIITQGKKGYSRHPETLRWVDHLPALALRHRLLVSEMDLRGFRHNSPLPDPDPHPAWPLFLEEPDRQFALLGRKYRNKKPGRIALPGNCISLWAAHKYSVMARDYNLYKETGRQVARKEIDFAVLAVDLVHCLHRRPPSSSRDNAIEHMWGYVKQHNPAGAAGLDNAGKYALIRRLALEQGVVYLRQSTALGELRAWE